MDTRKRFASLIKSMDMFGEPVPSFNIGGKMSVKTFVGAGVSLMLFTLTIAFGLLKLQNLFNRKNPNITMNKNDIGR